jgi:hypothetical protein
MPKSDPVGPVYIETNPPTYILTDTCGPFIHPVQGARLHINGYSSTDIPHLHPKYIKLDTFIGERLISKCLAGCTNTLFKTTIKPQSVVTVTILIY